MRSLKKTEEVPAQGVADMDAFAHSLIREPDPVARRLHFVQRLLQPTAAQYRILLTYGSKG